MSKPRRTMKPEFEKGITIRTTAKAQRAIDRVVAAVKSSDRVLWNGGQASKEAIINASWLWMNDLPEDVIEDAMAVYVPRLEALMRGGTATEPVTNPEPDGQVRTPPSVRGETDPRKRRRQSETG